MIDRRAMAQMVLVVKSLLEEQKLHVSRLQFVQQRRGILQMRSG
jgi:hypothetical protein